MVPVSMILSDLKPTFQGYKYIQRQITRKCHKIEPVGQQSRWLEILEEYDFQVQHCAGRLHTNADALSRRAAVTRD